MNTSAGSDGCAVKATGLTRRFGDLTAVDHIGLRVLYGEIFGLRAPEARKRARLRANVRRRPDD